MRWLAWLSRPKRGNTKKCGACGTKNEPDRTVCIKCGEPV